MQGAAAPNTNYPTMLYLIGGASRAGKSTITRRLFVEGRIPYFCTDYLVSGLGRGAPQLGIDGDLPNPERAERTWPVLQGLLTNTVEVEPLFTVEGDILLPDRVRDFVDAFPGQVRAVFLGYAEADVETKLAAIRAHHGGHNDWLADHEDDYVRELVTEEIAFSRLLRQRCTDSDLPYFETSEDFVGTTSAAFDLLTAQ